MAHTGSRPHTIGNGKPRVARASDRRPHMIDHPVFVPTTAGPVGGVVTAPDGPATDVFMVMHGANGTKAGPNALWAKIARSLAADGALVLRVDYPGIKDSGLADKKRAEEAME